MSRLIWAFHSSTGSGARTRTGDPSPSVDVLLGRGQVDRAAVAGPLLAQATDLAQQLQRLSSPP